MPLARIITDVADDCLELTMQLRARGFQVETVSPGAIPSTPADLEVRLEECSSEDVVLQASNGVTAEDLWVYVAPGALDSNAFPVRTVPLASQSVGDHSSPSSKITSILARQKSEMPMVLGSLAIDSHEEDPILAELHSFPKPEPPLTPTQKLSALLVEIPDLMRPSTSLPKTPLPLAGERTLKVTPEKVESDAPHVKWLVDPEKKLTASSPALMIPIAPDPVRPRISLPFEGLRPAVRRKVQWNFQPLQVACGLAMLALLAWMLILSGRPEALASRRPQAALPASKLVSGAAQPADKASVPQSAAWQKAQKPATAKPQGAVALASTAPASHAVSNDTTRPSRLHHEDGLIAADTVVFYDGRRPGPPRAKVQPEPGVKRYSDQN